MLSARIPATQVPQKRLGSGDGDLVNGFVRWIDQDLGRVD